MAACGAEPRSPSTPARRGPRHQRLRARGQPTEPLGRCVVSSSRMRVSSKYGPEQRRYSGETSLFALSYLHSYGLGDQRKVVPTQVRRLERTLNKPSVVLVVGVVAVALNVLLYFGYFLPRMTPLVEQINSIGTSLPEAIGKFDSETDSKSDAKASSKSDTKVGSKSDAEASGGSASGASGESGSEESLESSSDSPPDSPSRSPAASQTPQQQSSEPPQSPSGSPPELPPQPTPSQVQYQ
jgi:hypothetical protein